MPDIRDDPTHEVGQQQRDAAGCRQDCLSGAPPRYALIGIIGIIGTMQMRMTATCLIVMLAMTFAMLVHGPGIGCALKAAGGVAQV
ncbi:MAG: hypothetical protein Devi2KO_32680 [Devosia indica]